MATTPARMVQRRRTVAQWASENPVLAAGEIGIATGGSAPLVKVGDGTTAWNDLGISLPEIQVGTLPTNTVFGGFETEDVSFNALEMHSTAAVTVTNGFPRFTLPDAASTTVYTGWFNCPQWYKAIDIHLGVTNDHTATGNVRIQTVLKECDIGEALSAAGTLHTSTQTFASPGANGVAGVIVPVASLTFTPGFFGSVYYCEVTRLGSDGADTLAGPLGLGAIGFLRKNP